MPVVLEVGTVASKDMYRGPTDVRSLPNTNLAITR